MEKILVKSYKPYLESIWIGMNLLNLQFTVLQSAAKSRSQREMVFGLKSATGILKYEMVD